MRRNMPVVIAGNYQQFKSWCWEQGLHERDALWVADESRLRGLTLHRDQVRYVGSCADRADFLDLEAYVNVACSRTDEAGFDWKDTERGKAHLREVAARELRQVDNREKRAVISDINVRMEKMSTAELSYIRAMLRSDRMFGGMRGPTPTVSYMDEIAVMRDADGTATFGFDLARKHGLLPEEPLSLADEKTVSNFGVEGLTREMMKPVRDAARKHYLSEEGKQRIMMECRIAEAEHPSIKNAPVEGLLSECTSIEEFVDGDDD